jgi:hypothetical protein
MTAVTLEIPSDLAEPLEKQAGAMHVEVARYITAIIREKLRIPVKVGDLEVYAPADVLEYEMERAPDESDEEYQTAKALYGQLFGAATR